MNIAKLIRQEVLSMREAAAIIQFYIWVRRGQKITVAVSDSVLELMMGHELQLLADGTRIGSTWLLQNGY